MERYTIDECLNSHPYGCSIIIKQIKDKSIDEDINVTVLFEGVGNGRKTSKFYIFISGYLATERVEFPCDIIMGDIVKIGRDIVDEYLKGVKIAQEEKGYIISYDSEDDLCPLSYENPKEKYYIENFSFRLTHEKWGKKYGYKSNGHRQQIHDSIMEEIKNYMKVNGDDVEHIRDLVDYIKVYSHKDCRYLFR